MKTYLKLWSVKMAKIKVQDIADHVGTSRVTVWKALNNKEGVSDKLKQRIIETADSMGYFDNDVYKGDNDNKPSKTVALLISRPDSSNFWLQIIHQLAKTLSKENVDLLYSYLPSKISEQYVLPTNLYDGTVDAAIVINVYSSKLLGKINSLKIPKIFLDLSPDIENDRINGDLLFIEGKNAVYRLTQKLLKLGKSRIAFVGDIFYAKTNLSRYEGYKIAFNEVKKELPNISLLGPIPIDSYNITIRQYLDKFNGHFPEAFVCSSDHIAYYIEEYFQENNIPRKDNIILTGFDNNKEYRSIAGKISTVAVDTSAIGDILANKILFRLEHENIINEISYVSFPVIFRGQLKDNN